MHSFSIRRLSPQWTSPIGIVGLEACRKPPTPTAPLPSNPPVYLRLVPRLRPGSTKARPAIQPTRENRALHRSNGNSERARPVEGLRLELLHEELYIPERLMDSLLLIVLSPLFVSAGGLWLMRRLGGEHRRKSPVSEKVCRFPGYSLSQQVEELDEKLNSELTLILLLPAVTAAIVGMGLLESLSPSAFWISISCYLGVLAFFVVRCYTTVKLLQRMRLGLCGERLVGHQLEELRSCGFLVFHDIPLDYGNIDHVAVGPPGVFAIETKYQRKTEGVENNHKIRFDGERLHFPVGVTRKPVRQAKRQAEELSKLLNKMFPGTEVTPALVYPGWFVEEPTRKTPILVKNPKRLIGVLLNASSQLPPERVRHIGAFLEERCRDVQV